jgi:hypothetical protein
MLIALQFFLFIEIPYLIYLLSLIKTTGISSIAKKIFIIKYGGYQAFGKERLNQFWHDKAVDSVDPDISEENLVEITKIQREQKEKYQMNKIIFFTSILTSLFLMTYLSVSFI